MKASSHIQLSSCRNLQVQIKASMSPLLISCQVLNIPQPKNCQLYFLALNPNPIRGSLSMSLLDYKSSLFSVSLCLPPSHWRNLSKLQIYDITILHRLPLTFKIKSRFFTWHTISIWILSPTTSPIILTSTYSFSDMVTLMILCSYAC